MEYRIEQNQQYNSNEIYFNGIPSAEIRNALKGLKYRWHNVKKCWYGYSSTEEIEKALKGETEPTQQTKKESSIKDYSHVLKKLNYEEFKIKSHWRDTWNHTYSYNKNIVIDAAFIDRRAKEDYRNYLTYELNDGLLIEIKRPTVERTMYYNDEYEAPRTTEKNLILYNLRYNKYEYKLDYASDLQHFYFIKNYNGDDKRVALYWNRRGSWDDTFELYKKNNMVARQATTEEVKAILTEYAKINLDYIERIKKAYKRYGCTTYGYWANR